MPRGLALIGTLTIANGATESSALSTRLGFGSATDLVVYGPPAATGTLGVEVARIESPAAGDWRALKVDGTQIAVGALDATVIPTSTFASLRVKSSASEGAERILYVLAQVDVS